MLITGCDYHPGVQRIAFMETEKFGERRLEHGEGEAEKFLPRSAASRNQGAGWDGSNGTCTLV